MKTFWKLVPILSLVIAPFVQCICNGDHTLSPTNHLELDPISNAEMLIKSREILNDLKRAKGILPTEAPFIQVATPTGHKIAATYIEEEKIILDPEAYRICANMERIKQGHFENSLAYILGHELGHFINNHGDQNELITNAVVSVEERLNTTRSNTFAPNSANAVLVTEAVGDFHRAEDEGEADLQGAILGYLAGYNTAEAGKAFLGFAYEGLDINENSSKYPSLTQRQNLIDQTSTQLKKLVPLFEMANYLVAIEQYEDAIPYLERILPTFQSREIYNNIGVMYLLETLRLFEKPLTEYKFPLTLDSKFRAPHPNLDEFIQVLPSPMSDGWDIQMPCQLSDIQYQVNRAKLYFRKAIQLDQKYSISYLNLSIAESIGYLLFDQDDINCTEWKREELDKALGNVYEAKSILWTAMTGDTILSYAYTPEGAAEYMALNPEQEVTIDTIIMGSDTAFSVSLVENSYVNPFSGWDSIRAPFKLYYIGNQEKTEMSQIGRIPAHTTASNAWNPGAEERKVQISNIHTQMDIIEILKGNLVNGRIERLSEFGFTIMKSPFFKALSFNPKNLLAIHNRNIAMNTESVPTSMPDSTERCDVLSPIANQSLLQIYESITDWERFRLKKSKLVSFIKRFEGMVRTFQPMRQSMEYQVKDGYHIYANTTEMDIDQRVERSIVASPITYDTTANSCSDSIGTPYSELEQRHGPPSRVVTLTGGSYAVYELKNDTAGTFDGQDTPSRLETTTKGIIYKLNYNNELSGWAYFDRIVNTSRVDN